MNDLHDAVEQYLEMRRSFGYDLRIQAGILRRFAAFAEREEATYVTTNLVLRWAGTLTHTLPSTTARAVSVVRRFCLASQIKWTRLVDFCVTSRPGRQAGTATSCCCPTWSFSSFSFAALAQACQAGSCTATSPR